MKINIFVFFYFVICLSSVHASDNDESKSSISKHSTSSFSDEENEKDQEDFDPSVKVNTPLLSLSEFKSIPLSSPINNSPLIFVKSLVNEVEDAIVSNYETPSMKIFFDLYPKVMKQIIIPRNSKLTYDQTYEKISYKLTKSIKDHKEATINFNSVTFITLLNSLANPLFNILISGIANVDKNQATTFDKIQGAGQITTAVVSAGSVISTVPSVYNYVRKKYKKYQGQNFFHSDISDEEIQKQVKFTTLYLFAINENTTIQDWNDSKKVDYYIEKVTKIIIDSMVNPFGNLSYNLIQLRNEETDSSRRQKLLLTKDKNISTDYIL